MRDFELYRHLLGRETRWTVRSVELNVPGQRVDVWAGHASAIDRWHFAQMVIAATPVPSASYPDWQPSGCPALLLNHLMHRRQHHGWSAGRPPIALSALQRAPRCAPRVSGPERVARPEVRAR
jgi:hypothetical protein